MQRSFSASVRINNNASSFLRLRISLGLNSEPSKPHNTATHYLYVYSLDIIISHLPTQTDIDYWHSWNNSLDNFSKYNFFLSPQYCISQKYTLLYLSFCLFPSFLQGDPALLFKLNTIYTSSEIEFLDINLTKDSSLLLHAIHSPFYLANFKENHTLRWFK